MWDWIYEPYLADHPQGEVYLARIRSGYRSMGCYLRLPFHHETQLFRNVVTAPLITRHTCPDRQDVLRRLGIHSVGSRPLVLYAMRSPGSLESLVRAARCSPDRLFLHFEVRSSGLPENTLCVRPDAQLGFGDVLSACDAVVSKLGYGILADCVSTQTAILFPPRKGFREDEILVPAAKEHLRACEIPLDDYERGNWATHLELLESIAAPAVRLGTDGAAFCADRLCDQCRNGKDGVSDTSEAPREETFS